MKKNKGKIKNAVSLVSNGLTFKSKLEDELAKAK